MFIRERCIDILLLYKYYKNTLFKLNIFKFVFPTQKKKKNIKENAIQLKLDWFIFTAEGMNTNNKKKIR